MALIKSISGIRGTIGGKTNDNFTPLDIVKFTAAFGTLLLQQNENKKVVVGRDGRISGAMVKNLVIATLNGLGIDVVDLDYSTTPTVEMAVVFEQAAGGIILTASHNPKEWNALKLLNHTGEFIDAEQGAKVLEIAEKENFNFVSVDKLGTIIKDESSLQKHIDAVLNYPLVDVAAIKKAKFKIVLDAVNSTGAIAVPAFLKEL
jgi:phosphomannomutase